MRADEFMPGEAAVAGIRADIERYEAERSRAHRAVLWRVPVFDGLVLAAIFATARGFNNANIAHPNEQWLSTPHVLLYVFGMALLFFVHSQATKPARQLQQSLRGRILPVIFGFIGTVAYRHGETPDSFERLPRETVGSFNRQSFDDVVSGYYDGFPFELYEATLRSKAGKSSSEVFRGIVVSFETVTPFPGVLVAARRAGKVAGFFRGLLGEKLQEIHSGDAALDEVYEFRTDNVEAARPLPAGAGAEMAARDLAGKPAARRAQGSRRLPADPAVEELLRAARHFAGAGLQGARGADGGRHGGAARHRGACAQGGGGVRRAANE